MAALQHRKGEKAEETEEQDQETRPQAGAS